MSDRKFELVSPFKPAADQVKAIESLHKGLDQGIKDQVLLGVTGSGKTYTMAQVIQRTQRPALVLVHNKTLAAQLFSEFKALFPKNAVEYFVSYYDYYQPEAYIPITGTYIEKDSSVNEQIDRMRHSATESLVSRNDVIIVSSVSCIYGIGSKESYKGLSVQLKSQVDLSRNDFLRQLVAIRYKRQDDDFSRGTFRVQGDVVDVYPASEEYEAIRVEFFGDFVEGIYTLDPITGSIGAKALEAVHIFPGSHYVSNEQMQKQAVETIRTELRQTLKSLQFNMKYDEKERLEKRTLYDLEMIQEMGFCPGIENYSRHFTGRDAGQAPPTLLEYFPDNFLTFIDESHVTLPQVRAMYVGDAKRKQNLVEYGFRLPSALDNRPLNFSEFEKCLGQAIYVSATPSQYEIEKSKGLVVELINRPTGLLDPVIEIRKSDNQVENLIDEIKKRVKKKERILITTLTKKNAESLADHYLNLGIKVKYLHSDIDTLERINIIKDLRLGVFDVLIGINLLREGLDIPEVSLVAILDADKEGFLRSETSFIQTMGRAARHVEGRAIFYANRITGSMQRAIDIVETRRKIQIAFNKANGIIPKGAIKVATPKGLLEIYGYEEEEIFEDLDKGLEELKVKLKEAKDRLDFEKAIELRDKIKRYELKKLL